MIDNGLINIIKINISSLKIDKTFRLLKFYLKKMNN